MCIRDSSRDEEPREHAEASTTGSTAPMSHQTSCGEGRNVEASDRVTPGSQVGSDAKGDDHSRRGKHHKPTGTNTDVNNTVPVGLKSTRAVSGLRQKSSNEAWFPSENAAGTTSTGPFRYFLEISSGTGRRAKAVSRPRKARPSWRLISRWESTAT